jgi:predicted Zn finger-like uncharacterized protein
MAQYRCPECEAVLRPKQEIAPGKKVRCPKCETIFEAKPIVEAPAPAKAKAKAPAKPDPKPAPVVADDEEDNAGGIYVVVKDTGEKAPELTFGDIRDKYPKSNKGPAMAKTVGTSNLILMGGIVVCIAAIAMFLVPVFRFVFYAEEVTPDERIRNFWLLGGGVLLFIYGCMICLGASKLQNLESYPLAMTGCVMAIPLIIGLLGIKLLRDEQIRLGFEEVKNNKDPY